MKGKSLDEKRKEVVGNKRKWERRKGTESLMNPVLAVWPEEARWLWAATLLRGLTHY